MEQLLEKVNDLLFLETDEATAKVFGIGKEISDYQLIGNGPDIYDLIENLKFNSTVKAFKYFSILTFGWAAPLNNGEVDGAPSNHPEKRRVRLVILSDVEEKKIVGSIIKFLDTDELVYDFGDATGNLADALEDIFGE